MIKKLLISVAFACTTAQASVKLMSLKGLDIPVGFRASIDLDVARNAANEWFDTIIQVVNGIKIPNVIIDKKENDYMKKNIFYIGQRVSDVTLTSDVKKNAVVLNCKKLTAKFRSS